MMNCLLKHLSPTSITGIWAGPSMNDPNPANVIVNEAGMRLALFSTLNIDEVIGSVRGVKQHKSAEYALLTW